MRADAWVFQGCSGWRDSGGRTLFLAEQILGLRGFLAPSSHPEGDLAVFVLIGGSNSSKKAWYYHKNGVLSLFAIHGDKLVKLKDVPAGGLPEAIAFSPDGGTLYVGNFFDKDISIYKVKGTEVTDTGRRLKLDGHPAAGRAGP